MIKKTAVILAGGSGTRAGNDIPKQFQLLGDFPVLWWSIKAFYDEDPNTKIIVVIHPNYLYDWEVYISDMPENQKIEHIMICGGRSRWHSVFNALMEVDIEEDSYIAIHDGARPLISCEMIARGWKTAIKYGTAIPCIPLSDSVRMMTDDQSSKAMDRSLIKAVQTPQIFSSEIIKHSYSLPEEKFFTDDASVAEYAGYKINLYDGETTNIKITYPQDFKIAQLLKPNL